MRACVSIRGCMCKCMDVCRPKPVCVYACLFLVCKRIRVYVLMCECV